MDNRIGENEELSKVLEDAGCKCLIGLYKQISDLAEENSQNSIVDLMLSYIAKEKSEVPE